MSSSRPNDKSLLDRLNALKTSSVTLDHTPNTASFTTVTPQNQPVSTEDALAERLRQLRQGNTGPNLPRPEDRSPKDGPVLGSSGNSGGDKAPTPLTTQPPATPRISSNRDPKEQLVNSLPSTPTSLPRTVSNTENAGKSQGTKNPYFRGGPEDVDDDDVQALLEDLGGEDFNLTDAPFGTADTKTEDQKVEELLAKLSKAVPPSSDNEEAPDDDENDNSDGEHMTAAVDKILSQTRDELVLSNSTEPEEAQEGQEDTNNNRKPSHRPTGSAPPTKEPSNFDSNSSNPLELPSVPSTLTDDPAPDPTIDILSSRLAALRGIGPVDSFGLPAAPTFSPEDRPTPARKPPPLGGREEKYTDEDVKTWCVVCLDDGTIKCIGCDSDLYCDRCWREMHVGPRVGYDERGHQWVRHISKK
ncbi:hypothetical protein B0T21DRAFT_355297 [Apiosordaria backusii]|uniref:Abscission/NoCut checkpoint regulator n=1 Tax=Apiosordaria backusii TaxID=314023 RepID=A0AA40EYG3_9PEZI|nr:hypothetical protein B0T21DRAFT_355297 [Apiosordaria backusii]